MITSRTRRRRIFELMGNPKFQRRLRQESRDEKAGEAKARAQKYAKTNPLCTYRICIGITPLPPYRPSCNEETFQAYGNRHAKEIVREIMNGLRKNGSGWKYDLLSFLKVVIKEKTTSLLGECDWK